MKTIHFHSADSGWNEVIMVDKIVRLSKSDSGDFTYIHLVGGEEVRSNDSIKTLEARLNSDNT